MYAKAMKATSFLHKISNQLHRHHHSGHVKWSRRGETFTDDSYEVTEREVKYHERLQAQSDLQRFTS